MGTIRYVFSESHGFLGSSSSTQPTTLNFSDLKTKPLLTLASSEAETTLKFVHEIMF